MISDSKNFENLSTYFLNLANKLVSFTTTLGYKYRLKLNYKQTS